MRNCHVKDLCKSTFGNIFYMLMLASVQYFPLKGKTCGGAQGRSQFVDTAGFLSVHLGAEPKARLGEAPRSLQFLL